MFHSPTGNEFSERRSDPDERRLTTDAVRELLAAIQLPYVEQPRRDDASRAETEQALLNERTWLELKWEYEGLRKARRFDEALKSAGRGFEHCTNSFNELDPRSLQSMWNLATAHVDLAQDTSATKLFLQLADRTKRALDLKPLDLDTSQPALLIIDARNMLSAAAEHLLSRRNFEPALAIQERVVELTREIEKPFSVKLGMAYYALWLARYNLSLSGSSHRDAASTTTAKRAWNILQHYPDHDKMATLHLSVYLAARCVENEALTEAEEHFGRAMQRLDFTHPALDRIIDRYSFCLRKNGKFEEAENLTREWLQRYHADTQTPNYQTSLALHRNLMDVLIERNKLAEAEALLDEVANRWGRRAVGKEAQLLAPLLRLTLLSADQDSWSSCAQLAERALSASVGIDPARNKDPKVPQRLLQVRALMSAGRASEASDLDERSELFKDAIALQRDAVKKISLATSMDELELRFAKLRLARMLAEAGNNQEARELAEEARFSFTADFGPSHPRVAQSLLVLGREACSREDFERAHKLLHEAEQIVDASPGEPGLFKLRAQVKQALADLNRTRADAEEQAPELRAQYKRWAEWFQIMADQLNQLPSR